MSSPVVEFGTVRFNTADDVDGVMHACENLTGWADMPESDSHLYTRSQDYGAWYGDPFYGPRILELHAALVAPTRASLAAAINRLKAAHWRALRDGIDLAVTEVDGRRMLTVRPTGQAMTVHYLNPTAARIELEMAAGWPVKRSTSRTLTAVGHSPGVGRRYPRGGDLPFRTYGAAGTSGDMRPANAGNAIVRPVAVIAGPVTNPQIIAPNQHRRLAFATQLGAGDQLAVDFDSHTVVLNQAGNRLYVLTPDSAWFDLLPGENLIQYRSETNSGTCTLIFTDGWW